MKEIYILTKNPGKILAAESVFSRFGITVKNISKNYSEIQSLSSIEIAKNMAIEAAKEFKVAVVREDHSICLNAFSGMPGPFMSWFDEKMPAEQLLGLLKNAIDREGYLELAAAYVRPDGKVKEFVYRIPIFISEEARGSKGNWDKIIILKEKPTKTIGETSEEENVHIWNKNYENIAKEILKEDK